eukprot:TRINITY_DN3867_c0_g1_i1.p1 TRINITY_DN3867_c0_g1~~TRINITY_DN3867_c0_g1_i1.p1  ORF type:complete len:112 (-),score=12.59 TRINITY_DN3867_c0_g1_i1:27-362(-)
MSITVMTGADNVATSNSEVHVTGAKGIVRLTIPKALTSIPNKFVLTPWYQQMNKFPLEGCSFTSDSEEHSDLLDSIVPHFHDSTLTVTFNSSAINLMNEGGVLQFIDYYRF